jgi:predicted nucleic acid-binding protein
MNIVIDTSAIIAIITNESTKPGIILATQDVGLVAPESIHWEIGNAFSAMFKRRLVTLDQATSALQIYNNIPIRYMPIELEQALAIASRYNIYAYDAYVIECALLYKSPLLTLDAQLADIAERNGVRLIRI